jgi:putative toxin-antitoxin system antitoxin component (TIGR02293 family)
MEETSKVSEEPPAFLRKGAIHVKSPVRQHLTEAGESGFRGGTPALVAMISRGLPFGELETLREQLDLPLDRLAGYLGVARATLHRRKLAGTLTPDESDKVLRFARLLGQAMKVFGGIPEAREWLRTSQFGLGGAVPLEFAGTEVGAREVEALLGRIDYGVYS